MTERAKGAAWQGAHYDSVSDPQFGWGTEILSRLGDVGAGAVLDAGCGSGRVTEVLCSTHTQAVVAALDVSASMLEQARRRLSRFGPRISYVLGDLSGELAELAAIAPFEAIVSTGTLHWVNDHAALYRRLFDVLVPGGSFVAQCGGEGSIHAVRLALDELGIEWRGFNRYAGAAESARWLTDAGFCDVWTWLSSEPVEFDEQEALVDYLLGGVLAPYIAHCQADEQRRIAEAIVGRLESRVLEFVRLNVLARRPR